MSLFRVAVMILGLAAIAMTGVHVRWGNAHYAYLIQKEYERHVELKRQYQQKRLELARRQSPRHLLEQVEKWKLPLEGWIPDETKAKTATKPASTRPSSRRR